MNTKNAINGINLDNIKELEKDNSVLGNIKELELYLFAIRAKIMEL